MAAVAEDARVPEYGLLIRAPYIDWILDGTKTWEIRSRRTKRRGKIGLIQSRSGTVVGEADLVEVKGPLSVAEFRNNAKRWGGEPGDVGYAWEGQFAWVVENARRYERPVPYKHPPGAVIWVKLK